MRGVVSLLGLVLAVIACGPSTSPSTSTSADATALPNGVTRVWPSSGPAVPDVAASLTLNTHCGLENAVIDFGGTLWDVVGYPGRFPNPPRGIGNPVDEGSITLVLARSAVLQSASGLRLDLVPHSGPKDVFVCY